MCASYGCLIKIALFYAIGQGASALAPLLFGILIQSNRPVEVFYGDLFGAALMAGAGIRASSLSSLYCSPMLQ